MTTVSPAPIAVLGAGSWGTALALQLARAGQSVQLWCFDPEQCQVMRERRENPDYLPGVAFPDNLRVTDQLAEALYGVADVLMVTPSHAFSSTLAQAKAYFQDSIRLIWGTKGLDPHSGKLLHDVASAQLGVDTPMAVLSGPSFAKEVGANLPTAVVIAGNNAQFNADFAAYIHSDHFRPYTSEDLIGVQLAGAVKNPVAVAAGISDGLGLGANARCALITRGLAEITRLGVAMGGRAETFSGLAGLGDLVLTCTDDLSRNRRFGLALGRGNSVTDALALVGQVVEGNKNAQLVHAMATHVGVSMPIVEQVCAVVTGSVTAEQAVCALLERKLGQE